MLLTGTIPLRARRTGAFGLSRVCNRTTEEMQFFETAIGVIAAMLTSLSYVPQVRKVRAGQSTKTFPRAC